MQSALVAPAGGWLAPHVPTAVSQSVTVPEAALRTPSSRFLYVPGHTGTQGLRVHFTHSSPSVPTPPHETPRALHLMHGFGANTTRQAALSWCTLVAPHLVPATLQLRCCLLGGHSPAAAFLLQPHAERALLCAAGTCASLSWRRCSRPRSARTTCQVLSCCWHVRSTGGTVKLCGPVADLIVLAYRTSVVQESDSCVSERPAAEPASAPAVPSALLTLFQPLTPCMACQASG